MITSLAGSIHDPHPAQAAQTLRAGDARNHSGHDRSEWRLIVNDELQLDGEEKCEHFWLWRFYWYSWKRATPNLHGVAVQIVATGPSPARLKTHQIVGVVNDEQRWCK